MESRAFAKPIYLKDGTLVREITNVEEAIDFLRAPILRVTGFDAPYPPFTSIEDAYRPNPVRVAKAIRKVMAY